MFYQQMLIIIEKYVLYIIIYIIRSRFISLLHTVCSTVGIWSILKNPLVFLWCPILKGALKVLGSDPWISWYHLRFSVEILYLLSKSVPKVDCNCFGGHPAHSCGTLPGQRLEACIHFFWYAHTQHMQDDRQLSLSTYRVSDTFLTVNQQWQIFHIHLQDQEPEAHRAQVIYSRMSKLSQFWNSGFFDSIGQGFLFFFFLFHYTNSATSEEKLEGFS